MTESGEPPLPTLAGVSVKTQQEALRILQAVLDGDLEACSRRMGAHGPNVLCPGDVFVFSNNSETGIIRWTDGLKDKSGSRRRGPAAAHTTCYIIKKPPTRQGIPPRVKWVRKVWKATRQLHGNDTLWSIVAYDFEEEGGSVLRTVEEALSSLFSPSPGPLLPPAPPPPPPPVLAPLQLVIPSIAGAENAQGASPHGHPQNAAGHTQHPSSPLTPSPVVEFRRPLFIQPAASTSVAAAIPAASSRRERLPSLVSLRLPRPRVMPFECAPHAARAAERSPDDVQLLALFS